MPRKLRGSATPRPTGYAARWRDENGKQRWLGGFTTEQEALDYSLKMKIMCRDGLTTIDPDITLREFADIWLDNKVKLSHNTRKSYRSHLDHRILPHLGHFEVRWLNYRHMQQWIQKITNHNPPYGRSAIRNAYSVLHMVLDLAAVETPLAGNPLDSMFVEMPELPPPAKKIVLSPDDFMRVFSKVMSLDEGRYRAIVWALLTTQMRLGEALGLRWEDISFKGEHLHVRYQYHGELRELRRVKSQSGERKIPLDQQTLQILTEHQREVEVMRATTPGWDYTHDFVFPNRRGRPWSHTWIEKIVREAGQQSNIPKVTPHVFRRTGATWLIKAGVPINIVSQRLGHASPDITWRAYVDVIDGDEYLASDELNRLMTPVSQILSQP